MYHITPDGPKRCRAKVKPCPYNGSQHFESITDARVSYESSRSEEVHSISKKKTAVKPKGLEAYVQATSAKIVQVTSAPRTIILSDVDGTLVRGSLVLDHAVWLHKHGDVDLGDAPANWLANQKDEKMITKLAESYRDAIKGKSLKELKIRDYMDEVMNTDQKFYTALDRLKEAKEAGHDVILISGSPQFLVGDFAKQFGFKAIGSTYHKNRSQRLNGRVTGMFGAEAKQQVIETLELESYDLVVAYGDTASDKPLLQAAHHSVLVDPTEETMRDVGRVDEILRH